MHNVSILFDDAGHVLSELSTWNGGFSAATLTVFGETVLGHHLKEWQTQGIPTMQEAISNDRRATTYRLFEDHVKMRDALFLLSLGQWMRNRGMRILTLPGGGVHAWEKMSVLPLSEMERFHMLYAFCGLPKADAIDWMKAIDDAAHAVSRAS
ncbi:MAG: hypothetical protein WA001_00015 [Patescibacteria group bacterium]